MSWENTHQRLQEEALRLFSARGFDAVTVAEIARAAGVSHMTFFRHFPTKEAVVLDDPYDPLIATAVSAQPADLSALERVRAGVLSAWQAIEPPEDETTRVRLRLGASHPRLRARMWENNHRTEEVVVAALVEDGVTTREARVATGAILGALTGALVDWADDETSGSLGEAVLSALAVLAPAGGPR